MVMELDEVSSLFQKLAEIPPEQVVKRCHVVHLPKKEGKGERFLVNLLNESYSVDLERREVIEVVTERPADEKIARLVLKYLIGWDSGKQKDDWFSLDKVVGGAQLIGQLNKRAARPFLESFGYDVNSFEAVCRIAGGSKEKLGGVSYSFDFFPKFKVLVQLWVGDQQSFRQPAVNFLFSRPALQVFKPNELVDVAEVLVDVLLRNKKKMRGR